MLGKDEKLLFSSTCIMDNYINLYKGYDSSHEIYCFHLQKHTKIREWDNNQKKSDYCPIFFDFKARKKRTTLYDSSA